MRRFALSTALVLFVTSLVGCLSSGTHHAPPTPPASYEFYADICREVWRAELERDIDPGGLASCVAQLRDDSVSVDVIRAQVRSSPEWHAKHDATPVPETPPLARVTTDKRRFRAAGQRFDYAGITAFALADQIADGREADARAFIQQTRGFRVYRVLAMARLLFQLSPAEGRAALPKLFTLGHELGVQFEVVALADTASYAMGEAQLREQVRAIGDLCANDPACATVEIANEAAHPTQVAWLKDEKNLKALRALIPASVPVSLASNCCGQSDEEPVYAGGDFATVHLDRSRDRWNRVRRVRELENLAQKTGKPVVDDEPMGADERLQPGKRDNEPAAFFAQGVLDRLFLHAGTFHCEACLRAKPLGPVQLACMRAYLDGFTLPPAGDYRFENAGWATSPVKSAAFKRTVVRAYSFVGPKVLTVLVGLTGDPQLQFQHGYRAGPTLADRGAVKVLQVTR